MKVLLMFLLSGLFTGLVYTILNASYQITVPFGMSSLFFIGSWATIFMVFSLADLRESN